MKTPYYVKEEHAALFAVHGPTIPKNKPERWGTIFQAKAQCDLLNSAYQAGLQDQGVGVERIMEVVKQWREEDNTGSIEAVDFPDAMENADSQGWLLLSDLRTRLQALFTQTQEPVAWMSDDGRVCTAQAKVNMPSVVCETYHIPLAKAIGVARSGSPTKEGTERSEPTQSAVLKEHSPQQTQEGMGLPDGRLSDEEIERLSTPEQWEGEDYMLGAMDMGLMVHKRDRMEAARIVKHVLRYCRDLINKSPTP